MPSRSVLLPLGINSAFLRLSFDGFEALLQPLVIQFRLELQTLVVGRTELTIGDSIHRFLAHSPAIALKSFALVGGPLAAGIALMLYGPVNHPAFVFF